MFFLVSVVSTLLPFHAVAKDSFPSSFNLVTPNYVFSTEDIATHGLFTLEDVLRYTPGTMTVSLDHKLYGGQRGLNGTFDKTLILIDGRPVQSLVDNEPFISHQFSTSHIQTVEISHLPAGVTYGSGAFTGIIHLKTNHRAEQKHLTELEVLAGTQKQRSVSMAFARQYGELKVSGSGELTTSHNWNYGDFVQDTKRFSHGSTFLEQDAVDVDKGDYINISQAIPFSFELQFKDWYLGTENYFLKTGKGLETVALNYNGLQYERREFSLQFLGWKKEISAKQYLNIEIQHAHEKVWGQESRFTQERLNQLVEEVNRNPEKPLSFEDVNKHFLNHYSQESSSGSQKTVALVRYHNQVGPLPWVVQYHYEDSDLLGYATSYSEFVPTLLETVADGNMARRPFYRTYRHALSLQSQWQNKHYQLDGGARFENHSLFGSDDLYHFSVTSKFLKPITLRFTLAQGKNEPTIAQLNTDRPVGQAPTQDLSVEYITGLEFQITYAPSDKFQSILSLYSNDITHQIKPWGDVYYNAKQETTAVNTGFEWSNTLDWSPFKASIGYSFFNPTDVTVLDSNFLPVETVESLNQPIGQFFASTTYRVNPAINITADLLYHRDIEAEHGHQDVARVINLSEAGVVNLTFSSQGHALMNNQLSYSLSVKNIMDETYYLPNLRNNGPKQFLQHGRSIAAQFQMEF